MSSTGSFVVDSAFTSPSISAINARNSFAVDAEGRSSMDDARENAKYRCHERDGMNVIERLAPSVRVLDLQVDVLATPLARGAVTLDHCGKQSPVAISGTARAALVVVVAPKFRPVIAWAAVPLGPSRLLPVHLADATGLNWPIAVALAAGFLGWSADAQLPQTRRLATV
jgi:hypothetical protein